MKPVFIFSLPRSGSTLLQRMLVAHSRISSIAEPWLLLPLVYMYREQGMLAEYSQSSCREALSDLVLNTRGGMETHRRAVRDYAERIYSNVGNSGSDYFLDKTPRYYKIINDISWIFPDSKMIFLFRNPLQVLASILDDRTTRSLDKLSTAHLDLYEGPRCLADGYRNLRGKALVLRYEKLVARPEVEVRRVCEYLELPYETEMVGKFHEQDLRGRMGDQIGLENYTSVATESLEKWRLVLADPARRYLAKRYVRRLESDVIEALGYQKNEVLAELDALPMQRRVSLSDLCHLLIGRLSRLTHANLYFSKRCSWARDRYVS